MQEAGAAVPVSGFSLARGVSADDLKSLLAASAGSDKVTLRLGYFYTCHS